MASAWIARETRPGRAKTYRVRHRLGGGESARLDGGSFLSLREARARRDYIAGELAALRVPELRLAEPAAPLSVEAAWAAWRASRIDVAEATRAAPGRGRAVPASRLPRRRPRATRDRDAPAPILRALPRPTPRTGAGRDEAPPLRRAARRRGPLGSAGRGVPAGRPDQVLGSPRARHQRASRLLPYASSPSPWASAGSTSSATRPGAGGASASRMCSAGMTGTPRRRTRARSAPPGSRRPRPLPGASAVGRSPPGASASASAARGPLVAGAIGLDPGTLTPGRESSRPDTPRGGPGFFSRITIRTRRVPRISCVASLREEAPSFVTPRSL